MYSKNDYRYYLEHQLMYSDDFLAHYGVKGMKWKKRKLKNPFAPKNQKVVVESFKDQKTGKEYKISTGTPPKIKPKTQKVESITSPKRKRSKKESDWNHEMQNYGKEYLKEQNKKKKR